MRFTFPLEGRFALAFKAFSDKERLVFFSAMGILVGSAIVLLIGVNRSFMVQIPASGGTLIEGVLNTPAHINPLLASGEIGSEADRDLTALIYSGLVRAEADGDFINDLAESHTISEDGLEYTFVLKENLEWHDGEDITADDIVFTIKTAQDSKMKSPKRVNWDGILVEKIDDLTVKFTLQQPYAPFLENATLGILPEHIWSSIDFNRFDTSKYNREPIGSGPYKVTKITTKNEDGDEIPLEYTLTAFKKFALGEPHISTIKTVFYQNEESLIKALEAGDVEAINSITPSQAKKLTEQGYRVEHTPLPRVLGVFWNQNQNPVLAELSVRKALSFAIDRTSIINNVLTSYGVPLDTPIPPGSLGYEPSEVQKDHKERLEQARTLLSNAGWTYSEDTKTWTKKTKKETTELRFSLATSEASELKAISQQLKSFWEELGVPVEVRVFGTGDLKETIVRPRKFDALFFGQVLGREGDPYPFWHSSQRLDPGLNIASYTNTSVDSILEKARTEPDRDKRVKAYQQFSNEVVKDSPATFLYAPEFLYIVPNKIKGLSIESTTIPSERFLNIYKWYINTDSVWKIFVKEELNN